MQPENDLILLRELMHAYDSLDPRIRAWIQEYGCHDDDIYTLASATDPDEVVEALEKCKPFPSKTSK